MATVKHTMSLHWYETTQSLTPLAIIIPLALDFTCSAVFAAASALPCIVLLNFDKPSPIEPTAFPIDFNPSIFLLLNLQQNKLAKFHQILLI